MRSVTVAATQFACSWDLPANAARAEALVRQAAGQGAEVVLIQELFAAPYFCIEQHPRYFELAAPAEGHPLIAQFQALARELGVVIPVSFFERAGPAFFQRAGHGRCRWPGAGDLPQEPHPPGAGL